MRCGPHRNDSKLSERTACRWLDVNRKLFHYASRRQPDEPLRSWLIERAGEHRRYGQRRLIVLARRAGFADNHKRIERIYRGAALQVRKRVRRKLALGRGPINERPVVPNQRWSPTPPASFFGLREGTCVGSRSRRRGKVAWMCRSCTRSWPILQAAAAKLSAVAPSDAVEPQPDDQVEATSRHDALESKLPFDGYGVIFDPLDEGDQRRVEASLKNDLEDVYRDLSEGAALYIRRDYRDAIWSGTFRTILIGAAI